MTTDHVILEDLGPVRTVRLNRPAERNALDAALIGELTDIFLSVPQHVRVIILTGTGSAFCAGADLQWMRQSATFSATENHADAARLATLFNAVDRAPAVVIGRINGVAMGGALGLMACCDLVATVATARFAFSEVRLGLAPAVIAPFVLRKIGMSQARRYFVTAEVFGAPEALSMGLVHRVLAADKLDEAVDAWRHCVLSNGPQAVTVVKELLPQLADSAPDAARRLTVEAIARLRISAEGQEGLQAFLEKRQPRWVAS